MDKLIRLLQQAEENNQKLFIQWMQTDPTAKSPDSKPIIGLTKREEIFAQMVTAHTHLVDHAVKLLQKEAKPEEEKFLELRFKLEDSGQTINVSNQSNGLSKAEILGFLEVYKHQVLCQ